MEAETDVMSKRSGDRADELSSDIVAEKDNTGPKRKKTRKNLIKTIFDGFLILFVGMQTGQRGAAFLDLQLISGTDVKGASSYISGSSFGYMVGALAAGVIYDRLRNKMILICIPVTLASFLIGLTPWCTSYITMMLAHIASAMQYAISETTVMADQYSIWQGTSDAALQFISFTFSLGGVLGPLYTEPFLAPKWNETDNNAHHIQAQEGNPKTNNVSHLMYNSLNSSVSVISIEETYSNVHFEDPPESRLYYAYMITGLFGVLFSIPYYVMWCKSCFPESSEEEIIIREEAPAKISEKRLTLRPYVVLITISSIFIFFYTMLEDSFNTFLSMFVVSHLSWTKGNGALLISLYWGISTISKLISVPLVRRFDIGIILLISSVGMVISLVGFLISSHYRIDVLIWITSSLFSMSQSAIFGGWNSWVDSRIIKLDGKATSVSMVSAALGAMAAPLILGITIDKLSVMAFPYVELIFSVITTCILIFVFFFLKPFVTRKYGPVRPKQRETFREVSFGTIGES